MNLTILHDVTLSKGYNNKVLKRFDILLYGSFYWNIFSVYITIEEREVPEYISILLFEFNNDPYYKNCLPWYDIYNIYEYIVQWHVNEFYYFYKKNIDIID